MSEERVTTGSEPRRTFTLKRMGYSPNACFIREGADQLHPGEAVRVVEVVEPGHDEQTEHVHDFRGDPPRCTFPGCYEKPWQPDPRTVAAVVAEFAQLAWVQPVTVKADAIKEAIAVVEERFKPSAPGGDDG